MAEQQGAKVNLIAPDPAWKGLYKAGGVSFLLVGIIFIVVIILIAFIGLPASTPEGALKAIAGTKTLNNVLFGLLGLASFFLVPAVLSLYFALKEVDRSY